MTTQTPVPQTCGHDGATTMLEGALYCRPCFTRAWENFKHRGHADEPPAVPLVPVVGRCPTCGGAVKEGQIHSDVRSG